MRCSARRALIAIVATAFLILVIKNLHSNVISGMGILSQRRKSWNGCRIPNEIGTQLHAIFETTHEILNDFQLTHFLCYGSLWGYLRRGKPLPWMSTAQFCVFNEQLVTLDEVFVLRTFQKKGLKIQYNSQEGEYYVTDAAGECECTVQVIVFERSLDADVMRRIGWTRRILPPTCEMSPSLNCFPSRLVDSPLAQVKYDNLDVNVPREESELQKYLYPDDWWMEIKPEGCENE